MIVCVRDEERHLPRQLAALAAQTYAGTWELVVVDNGSTDRTVAIAEAWRDRLPAVRVVDASAVTGLNYARNRGAEAAVGDLLAFADGDDEAVEGWLDGLVTAAAGADLVGGPLDGEALNGHHPAGWIPHDPMTELPLGAGFLHYAPGGNCAVWADVARQVRWNEDYSMGGSDVEFSWRVGLAGWKLGFAPEAVMRRQNPADLVELALKYFRYGLAAPRVYRDFRAAGMPPSDEREVASLWRFVVRRAPRAVTSHEFRGRWVRIAAGRLGRVVGSVRHRARYL